MAGLARCWYDGGGRGDNEVVVGDGPNVGGCGCGGDEKERERERKEFAHVDRGTRTHCTTLVVGDVPLKFLNRRRGRRLQPNEMTK